MGVESAGPPLIVVLDGFTVNPGDNPWDELASLGTLIVHDRTQAGDVVLRSSGAQILITNKTPIDAETMAQLPELRFISVLATGFNVVDVRAARARGIAVSNVPEYSTNAVAQHTFALLLELCHQVGLHHTAVTAGEWIRSSDFCFWRRPPVELAGLTMGIVGFGRIGKRVGEIANAFGMNVIVAGNARHRPAGSQPSPPVSIRQLFSGADVVTLHCPLTDKNAGFVNADLLACMKSSAFFINTARGGLVDEQALAAALDSGHLAGAAVDVVSVEPMRAENPLLGARNCVITPHMAWGSVGARRRLLQQTVRNVEAFLTGRPINVVN